MISNGFVEDGEEVIITPFEHQVGGHKVVLQISKRFLCKPLEEYEIQFYNKLPESLKDCVPHFKGVIQVKYTENDTGFQLRAKLPKLLKQDILQETSQDVNNGLINNNTDISSNRLTSDTSQQESESSSSDRNNLGEWSKKCLKRTMQEYALWSTNSSQQFIVLENLLSNSKYPCVLDMKLGRKQRVYDCSEEKRQLLESRCAHSTSASLGFRICGMQLYQKTTGTYISEDKYVGRALNDEGAISNLKRYFHDGLSLRQNDIRKMITKLQHIRKSMADQHVFHFLSVSLLLVYDSDCQGQVDARLIDFANAITQQDLPDQHEAHDYNEDLIFGISSVIDILEKFLL